ncbi:5-carboxymethyl-2-hydroxymuconate Delta-isomerase [Streptomyces sp. NPDC088770]|uniref:5-carboxymethyl-2-hydroxymuconate Delta-isomerase n=1 Tax=unclassified Streptomyces TaxID=2593676 RepID=UPI002DD9D309|nr:isomerase [Streptomyces sp. NBC_01788]WSB30633.1 isomerase [Streptomyces sp. NBC_01788]
MPHVTVTYTNSLGDSGVLEYDVLGPELHALIVANSGARAEACRIRFIYPQDDWYIADRTEETHQAVHIEIALKAGRSAEVKRALSESVLALLRTRVGPLPEFEVHFSVEVRDLDPDGYASHIESAGDVPQDT